MQIFKEENAWRQTKMVSIREEVRAYTPKNTETKNISELGEVSMSCEIFWEQFEYDGKVIKYAYILVDDVRYRIPNSVLKQLRILDEQYGEKFTKYRVIQNGAGLDTTYMVEKL